MELRNFGAVAFDFDGTLASTDIHLDVRKAAYEEMAIKLNDPRYSSIPDEVHRLVGRKGTTALTINAIILASQGIIPKPDPLHPATTELVELKEQKYFEAICKGQEEMPGAVRFLKRLMVRRPGRIGIVTTAHDWEVAPFLLRHKLNPYIPRSKLVAKEDLSSPDKIKPDPEAYLTFMGRIGIKKAEDCLVLEDSPLGVESAKRAGAVVVGMALDNNLNELSSIDGEYKPDAIVESYDELSRLLALEAG